MAAATTANAKRRTLIVVVVTAIASTIGALTVHSFPMANETRIKTMKYDNKPLMSLGTSSTCALGIICAVKLCAMCVRHTLHDPVTKEVAFIAGDAQHRGIKFHIDSGASTSRAVGTLTFLASDVHGDTRVAELDRAYYVPNQTHNLVSVN